MILEENTIYTWQRRWEEYAIMLGEIWELRNWNPKYKEKKIICHGKVKT